MLLVDLATILYIFVRFPWLWNVGYGALLDLSFRTTHILVFPSVISIPLSMGRIW